MTEETVIQVKIIPPLGIKSFASDEKKEKKRKEEKRKLN